MGALLAACACGSATAFAPSGPLSPRTSAALNLAVGETAPDFSLVDQNGKTFTRSRCKKPATAFQAEIQDIRKEFRADVVGVSGQDVASKQKFAADLGLDFSILADEGDAVRTAFAVPKAAFGFLPGRVTYVLDGKGVCQSVYDNLGDAVSHIDAAKAALADMKPAKKAASSLPF